MPGSVLGLRQGHKLAFSGQSETSSDEEDDPRDGEGGHTYVLPRHELAPHVTARSRLTRVRLAGFEPATYGLGIRCSIP